MSDRYKGGLRPDWYKGNMDKSTPLMVTLPRQHMNGIMAIDASKHYWSLAIVYRDLNTRIL